MGGEIREAIDSCARVKYLDPSELCAVISELIEGQPHGKPGPLTTKGVNIFLAHDWWPHVTWDEDRRSWGVEIAGRGQVFYAPGWQVFALLAVTSV